MPANAFKTLFLLLTLLATCTQCLLSEKKVSRYTPRNLGLRTSGSSESAILIFCGLFQRQQPTCSNDNSLHVPTTTAYMFQRQQPTSGGTVRSSRPANCCQHITSNRFLDGFPDPRQYTAAKLSHYSSNQQRPSDSSRSKQPLSPESLSDPHLEELSIKAELGNTMLIQRLHPASQFLQ